MPKSKTRSKKLKNLAPLDTEIVSVDETSEHSPDQTDNDPKVADETKSEPIIKKIKDKIKKIRSRRYQTLISEIDKSKTYPLEEAIDLIKRSSNTKFDATLEAHINLHLDVTKADQQVRSTVLLPHGSGKEPKILVFTQSPDVELKQSGVVIGDKQTVSDIINTGKISFDKVVATPEMMPVLTPAAKVLGPKGLMPNPKTGTVTTDLKKTIQELKSGLIEFKTDKSPIIHAIIGKSSYDKEKLVENFKTLLEAINRVRPKGTKGDLIVSIYITTTMSPSVRVDPSSLK